MAVRSISVQGAVFLFLIAAWTPTLAATLTVGAGKQFARIEEANAAAQPGDTIEIYPAAGDGIYKQPAVFVTKPRLTFMARGARRAVLDGEGFDYSGVGQVPRAIFQINPGADGVVIESLELRNAHNGSHNGAGVRINQANGVTVRRCDISGNDMGIMSNGNGADLSAAKDQLIENCVIHANGNTQDPGYNHNLYLGGTNVTLQYCDIYGALTGHNVKSRAHFNLIRYNFIHDSANRELDLVDAADTAQENSHSVLLGNFIAKKNPINGNSVVIHFGKEGNGRHRGNLYLLHNTIVTPYLGEVIQLSDPGSQAVLFNNIIFNPEQNAPLLVTAPPGHTGPILTGSNNWISRGYDLSKTALSMDARYTGPKRDSEPGFANIMRKDYHLLAASGFKATAAAFYLDGSGKRVPWTPEYQYKAIAWEVPRKPEDAALIGAGVK